MQKKVGKLDITYQNDRFINEVLLGKEYDFISYFPTIIDIGANIGTFSFYMYDHADKIYALEPVKENFDCLVKTVEKNKLDKITPVQMAISNQSFIQNMVRVGEAGGGGWKLSESGDYPVDARTLKDFMDVQNIEYADLVKIDVEGWEGRILNTPFFPKDRIGTIIGEFHEGIAEDLQGLLEYMGFRYIGLKNNHFIARKI